MVEPVRQRGPGAHRQLRLADPRCRERRDRGGRSVGRPSRCWTRRRAADGASTQVLNTHWHPDHTGGNAAIKDATGCTDHRAGRSRAGQQGRPHRRGGRPGPCRRRWRRWCGKSRPIPPATSLIISRTSGMIFVGDTLFAMGCGRLFEGNAAADVRQPAAARGASRRRPKSIAGTNIRSPTRASPLHAEPGQCRRSPSGWREVEAAARRRARSRLPTTVARGTRDQPLRSCSRCGGIRPAAGGKRQLPLMPDERSCVTGPKRPEGGCTCAHGPSPDRSAAARRLRRRRRGPMRRRRAEAEAHLAAAARRARSPARRSAACRSYRADDMIVDRRQYDRVPRRPRPGLSQRFRGGGCSQLGGGGYALVTRIASGRPVPRRHRRRSSTPPAG